MINPGFTYSYISRLYATCFVRELKFLTKPFLVSIHVEVSIVVSGLPGLINCNLELQTLVDLINFHMIDFDIIMGIDVFASCYNVLDFCNKLVRFDMPKEKKIEPMGTTVAP